MASVLQRRDSDGSSSPEALRCFPPSHGMLEDIWQTPLVLKSLITKHLKPPTTSAVNKSVSFEVLDEPLPPSHGSGGKTPLEVLASCSCSQGPITGRIVIIGSGTSYHVAILAEYLIEQMARIPVEVQCAGEYKYQQKLFRPGDVLIVVSSSGETSESVECLRGVKNSQCGNDVVTISFVNEANSTLGREADACICAEVGEEVGVTSTKGFSGTALAFVMFALAVAEAAGTLKPTELSDLIVKLRMLPGQVQDVLEKESKTLRLQAGDDERLRIGDCELWDLACQNALASNFMYLGRGFNFPIALEGALKCKELAYIHAEGYPAAEMKHGPIALIDQFMPVVVIAPKADPSYEKIKANIEEVNTRKGSTIAITEDTNDELDDICEYVIRVPETHEYLSPLIAVIPLQLLAYMIGFLRGNEVDNPRHLQKTIAYAFRDP